MSKSLVATVGAATYGPLVETCAAYGIRRTIAFRLAKEGLLETFPLGRRRFVFLASLRDLPQRLAEREDEANPAAPPHASQ